MNRPLEQLGMLGSENAYESMPESINAGICAPLYVARNRPLVSAPSTVRAVAGSALSDWVARPKMSSPCTVGSPFALARFGSLTMSPLLSVAKRATGLVTCEPSATFSAVQDPAAVQP